MKYTDEERARAHDQRVGHMEGVIDLLSDVAPADTTFDCANGYVRAMWIANNSTAVSIDIRHTYAEVHLSPRLDPDEPTMLHRRASPATDSTVRFDRPYYVTQAAYYSAVIAQLRAVAAGHSDPHRAQPLRDASRAERLMAAQYFDELEPYNQEALLVRAGLGQERDGGWIPKDEAARQWVLTRLSNVTGREFDTGPDVWTIGVTGFRNPGVQASWAAASMSPAWVIAQLRADHPPTDEEWPKPWELLADPHAHVQTLVHALLTLPGPWLQTLEGIFGFVNDRWRSIRWLRRLEDDARQEATTEMSGTLRGLLEEACLATLFSYDAWREACVSEVAAGINTVNPATSKHFWPNVPGLAWDVSELEIQAGRMAWTCRVAWEDYGGRVVHREWTVTVDDHTPVDACRTLVDAWMSTAGMHQRRRAQRQGS